MSSAIPATAREAVANRWRIARLVPQAGWGVVLLTAFGNLLLGALPVGFIVGTSIMLGRVPAAVAAGPASPEWSAVVLAFVLASAAFAGQQVLAPVQTALGELIARRVDGKVFDRLMAASLRSPGIGPLEDQALLDDLSEASSQLEQGFQSPGRACAGLLHLIARVVQLVGYVVVVTVAFSWLAGLGLLAAVLAFRQGQRGGLRRYSRVFREIAGARREHRYLRALAMQAPAAKEIRIFGLADWLRERYRKAYWRWLQPVWQRRRQILLWPYFWYSTLGLLVTAGVLAAVGASGAQTLTLTNLALVIQAILGGLRLGEFYPEADVQTQYGMNAYEAVRRFEQGVDAHLAAAAPATVNAAGTGGAAGSAGAGGAAGSAGAGGAAGVRTAPVPRQEIRFEGVRFGYPGARQPVLDGLDLRIPAGACTAIVGVNGAGKTTLVKLLTRLYEPQQGAVTVDGQDLRGVDLAAWRARTAVIFQDFNRYEMSAADNIGFGAVERLDDRAQIRAAATDAGILAALDRLPAGLDTPLARHVTGGVDLSGGQWQRVALARALFRLRHDGAVLVLDEPTASLDVRAEARFFDEFVALTRGATTVLISHRFSTVRHADHIVVLAGGRVIETGTHPELLHRNGRYAQLFRLQADRFTDSPDPAGPEDPAGPDDPAGLTDAAGLDEAAGPDAAGPEDTAEVPA